MGEVQYIWADPGSPNQQVALSSIVQGMRAAKVMGIARWVSKDGMDPRMGVVTPCIFDKVDCLLWAQVRIWLLYFLKGIDLSCADAICR
jgi:ATP-dependent DNA helicase 2 subunit 2